MKKLGLSTSKKPPVWHVNKAIGSVSKLALFPFQLLCTWPLQYASLHLGALYPTWLDVARVSYFLYLLVYLALSQLHSVQIFQLYLLADLWPSSVLVLWPQTLVFTLLKLCTLAWEAAFLSSIPFSWVLEFSLSLDLDTLLVTGEPWPGSALCQDAFTC